MSKTPKGADPLTPHKTSTQKTVHLWLAIFVPNLIVLLGVFPGFFVYDAQDELMEVVTRTFNTHHPLLHVLAMGGTVTGVHKITDSWNLGIFTYLALQALLISAIYAYILQKLSPAAPANSASAVTRPLSRPAIIGFTLWFALFPTVVMYTLCSTKDGLFSAFTTLFVMELALMLRENTGKNLKGVDVNKDAANTPNNADNEDVSKALDKADNNDAPYAYSDPVTEGSHTRNKHSFRLNPVLIFSAAAMMLLRNNAVYALVVFAAVLAVGSLIARASAKKTLPIILSIVIAFVLFFVMNKALIRVLQATDAEHQESITVAIQAIGRAWNKSPESFTDAEAAELKNWFTEEGLAGYEDRNSDFIKSTFNNVRYETNSGDFWHLWFSIAQKCPYDYIESWILTSSGMWNPFGVINTYEGHQVFTFTYTESSYFGYETEQPGVRTSLIPPIDRFYRWLSLDDDIQRIPVLSLLFAPAFWFWVYAAAGVYLLCRKRIADLIPLLPLYLLWLTYLLGPASLVRYALPFFTALPVLAYLLQAPASRKI